MKPIKPIDIINDMKQYMIYAIANMPMSTASCNMAIMTDVCTSICAKYNLTIAELNEIVQTNHRPNVR